MDKSPVVVKPNAGLPDPVTNEYNCSPEDFAEFAEKLIPLGVKVLGGCCGTNPEYIKSWLKCSKARSTSACIMISLPLAVHRHIL